VYSLPILPILLVTGPGLATHQDPVVLELAAPLDLRIARMPMYIIIERRMKYNFELRCGHGDGCLTVISFNFVERCIIYLDFMIT
jgi:hypothetical protein